MKRRAASSSRLALVIGFAFLYVPILSMIFFSFNNSRLVTVWDAANSPTLKWYRRAVPERADPQRGLAVDQGRAP